VTSQGGAIDRAGRWVARLEGLAATGAALALFAIMLIVVADVLLRYLFNAPLSWSYDLISIYLMGVAFFLALSETLRMNHHVAVDILYLRFPLGWRRVWRLVGWALSFVLFAIIFVLAVTTAWDRWSAGNVVAGAIPWPTWIPAAIAAAGFLLLLVRLALGVVALAITLVSGRRLDPDIAGDDVASGAH
jgi:TRAP-type C4-dicarboxylate transport system permease small subunit